MNHARWTIAAQQDLAAIDDHYRELNLEHADRVGRAALAAARFLADHPQAGPRVTRTFRKWRVAQTDYVLLYRPVPSGVEILRLHHVRQNWRPQS